MPSLCPKRGTGGRFQHRRHPPLMPVSRRLTRAMPAVLAGLAALNSATLSSEALAAASAPPRSASAPASKPAKAASDFLLKALVVGDRACYVLLASAAGEKHHEGSFELCTGGPKDANALIGRRVTFTTERAKVLAASCAGNMDCGKSDTVNLIVTLTAAPASGVRP